MKKKCGIAAVVLIASIAAWGEGFLPGERVLLDAHNCYPYQDKYWDRIDRALGTGAPLAVEQDLVWYTNPDTGASRSIVSHGEPFTGDEPSLKEYFFENIRGRVEAALEQGDNSDWPLFILNLDFKNSPVEHVEAFWNLLDEYEDWITTATKTDDIEDVQPLDVKPVLILGPNGPSFKKVCYLDVPVGGKLRMFVQAHTTRLDTEGMGRAERDAYIAAIPPEDLLRMPADNFHRWWNNSWYAIEEGGAMRSAEWTPAEEERLNAFVDHAHAMGYWIRFYTLNGHGRGEPNLGWSLGYNFGSREAVEKRWKACINAGVDFVATDMYEAFAETLDDHTGE